MKRPAAWRIWFAIGGIAGAFVLAPPAFAATKGVSIQNYAFSPASISIHVGDTVEWTQNQVGVAHTVTSDDGRFQSSGHLNYTNTYSVTFTKVGTYNYMCSIHQYMTGTITVTGATSTPTPTPTHSATPTPKPIHPKPKSTATATAKPTVVPVSPTPTSSAKPSPRASKQVSNPTPSSTPSRVVAAASSSSSQGGVTIGLIAGALVILVGGGLLVVRRRRTVP